MKTVRLNTLLIATVALIAASGCTRPFTSAGYQHPTLDVAVHTTQPGVYVSTNWRRIVRRAYRYGYGQRPPTLELSQRVTGAMMWVDIIRLNEATRDREFNALVDEMLARVTARSEAYARDSLRTSVGPSSIEAAAPADIAVSGAPGRAVLLRTADGSTTGTVVFLRANVRERNARGTRIAPVLILAGYVGRTDSFDEGVLDLVELLRRVRIGEPSPAESSAAELTAPATP